MPDGDRYELVDGQLVESDMGAESSLIAGEVFRTLANFNEEARLGQPLPNEVGYQCFSWKPDQVRRPDASFILAGRMEGGRVPRGHIPIPPDLAVEVVSPNDFYYEVLAKV